MRDELLERPLPNDAASERALLGAIILDNHLRDEAASLLAPDDFYVPANRRIYVAMLSLEGVEINPITLGNYLKTQGEYEAVGGFPYISDLSHGLPRFSSVKTYAKLIREKSLLRQLIRLGSRLTSDALEGETEGRELLNQFDSALAEMRNRHGEASGGFRQFQEVAQDALEYYERLARGEHNAIPTGYSLLDKTARGGIHQGELWVVAALTGKGKSAWAIGAARQIAQQGNTVGIVSREMSDLENFIRAHSAVSGVPAWHISTGLRPWDYERLRDSASLVADLPIWIDSRTSNLYEIRSKVKDLKRKGLTCLFVDYLQLLTVSKDAPYSTRAQEVAACSRILKEIAMDNQIGVFALAQFNRMAAHNEKPEIHHLAESGNIEKDADLVLILDMEEQKAGEKLGERNCTMRIAKHRNGPLLSLKYRYSGDTLTFSEAA